MIEENAITIRIRRSALSGGAVALPSSESPSDSPIELTAPAAFKRRGVEMRLVLPAVTIHNDRSRCDPTLLKAIARGRAWFDELAAGRARSLRELAERDGITRHCDASHRTRSAARLDRAAQSAGELKSDPRQSVSRPRPGLFSLSALTFQRGDCINGYQRKAAKASRLVACTSYSLVSSGLTLRAKAGPLCTEAMAGTGETDSPPEGRRFELSVPPARESLLFVDQKGPEVDHDCLAERVLLRGGPRVRTSFPPPASLSHHCAEPMSMSAGIGDKLAWIFLNLKCSIRASLASASNEQRISSD